MSEMPSSSRDIMPDLIRAFALIGIVMVNVEAFSTNMGLGFQHSDGGSLDHWAIWLTAGLFTLKSYSLFSMMFGAGLGYQMASAERKSVAFAPSYFRRMAGLLFLGLMHVIFLFLGDILVTYAILGCILYLVRNGSPRDFVIWAVVLIALQTIILLGMSGLLWVMETIDDPSIRAEFEQGMAEQTEIMLAQDEVFEGGSFLQVAGVRLQMLPALPPAVIMTQGISAFGFFLLGLTFFRTGLISDPFAKFWWWSRWVLLPIGVIASLGAAGIYAGSEDRQSAETLFAMGLLMGASAFSSLGYAGLIAKICQFRVGSILRFLARGGSATLSAYLLQSVILSFVTLEFGLGLYNQLNAFEAALIALATGLFTLSFVSIWLLFFKRGPMEILLRRWTYLGAPQAKTWS